METLERAGQGGAADAYPQYTTRRLIAPWRGTGSVCLPCGRVLGMISQNIYFTPEDEAILDEIDEQLREQFHDWLNLDGTTQVAIEQEPDDLDQGAPCVCLTCQRMRRWLWLQRIRRR